MRNCLICSHWSANHMRDWSAEILKVSESVRRLGIWAPPVLRSRLCFCWVSGTSFYTLFADSTFSRVSESARGLGIWAPPILRSRLCFCWVSRKSFFTLIRRLYTLERAWACAQATILRLRRIKKAKHLRFDSKQRTYYHLTCGKKITISQSKVSRLKKPRWIFHWKINNPSLLTSRSSVPHTQDNILIE